MTRGRKKISTRRNGFTLVEMVVTLSVMGLIAAITLPNFNGYLRHQRVIGMRNQLIADMYYARSLAISNRRTFAIRFQADRYVIVDTTNNKVARTIMTPSGVQVVAAGNANFYAWGLSDATNITLSGSSARTVVTLMPTGSVEHD